MKSKSDWWAMVEKNWEDLKSLCVMDLEHDGLLVVNPSEPGPLADFLQKFAETAHVPLASNSSKRLTESEICDRREQIKNQMEEAKNKQDHDQMLLIINRAWERAPDNHSILSCRRGWKVLCTLAESEYVFEEEDEQLPV